MTQFINRTLLVLLIATGDALAQFCPGLSPWVFDDVPSSHPFCTNITWMAQRGVTLGCGVINANHRLYCPSANVTRAEMAAYLYRLGFQNSLLQGGNALGTTGVFGTTDNQPLNLIAGGSRVMRYEPSALSPNLIGGNPLNTVSAGVRGATIGGGGVPQAGDPYHMHGDVNRVTDDYGTVGGGFNNVAGDDAGSAVDAPHATIGGGYKNRASGRISTIAGGGSNIASGSGSTIAGGLLNEVPATYGTTGGGVSNFASGDFSTVAGGIGNSAVGDQATVGGGEDNIAAGEHSTVVGGRGNVATGDYSFAAGRRAGALGDGSFAFADSNDFDFASLTANAFRVRATGGVRFVTDIDGNGGMTWSCLAVAGTGWSCSSDRNQKQNLRQLDGPAVLERLVTLPVFSWNPKGRNAHVNHYGPTAQDFHAAFGLGDDDTMIGTQDADGVALAAIQGLNAKLEAQLQLRDALIAEQRNEIAALRRAVDELLDRTGSLADATDVGSRMHQLPVRLHAHQDADADEQ